MFKWVAPLDLAGADRDVRAARWCLSWDAAFQVDQRVRFAFGEVGEVGRSDAGDADWADRREPPRLPTVGQLRGGEWDEKRRLSSFRELNCRRLGLGGRGRRARGLFDVGVTRRATDYDERDYCRGGSATSSRSYGFRASTCTDDLALRDPSALIAWMKQTAVGRLRLLLAVCR